MWPNYNLCVLQLALLEAFLHGVVQEAAQVVRDPVRDPVKMCYVFCTAACLLGRKFFHLDPSDFVSAIATIRSHIKDYIRKYLQDETSKKQWLLTKYRISLTYVHTCVVFHHFIITSGNILYLGACSHRHVSATKLSWYACREQVYATLQLWSPSSTLYSANCLGYHGLGLWCHRSPSTTVMSVVNCLERLTCPTENRLYHCMWHQTLRNLFPSIASIELQETRLLW